jgi:acetolactate decarboxylase
MASLLMKKELHQEKLMKKMIIGALVLIMSLFACEPGNRANRDILFQISTINALFNGIFEGTMSFKELKTHGDFTIGTFDSLDGELLGFDNNFYQVKADGKVYPVTDEMTTPFAVATFFDADKSFTITSPCRLEDVQEKILEEMGSENIFQAVKIEGNFSYVKTRSVPKQNKPFPQLIEVLKVQPTFEFQMVKGTIVGFWTPSYINEINVSGFHFHFITDDRTRGGHLLACEMIDGVVTIDDTADYFMSLPGNKDFINADFEKKEEEIMAGEKDK